MEDLVTGGEAIPEADQPSCAGPPSSALEALARSFLDSQDLFAAPGLVRGLDGRIVCVNRTLARMIAPARAEGRMPEEVGIGLPHEPLAQPKDIEVLTPQGLLVLWWQDRVVEDEASRQAQVFSLARDVTAERDAGHRREEARLHAEEESHAKTRHMATVVHELRTPLTGILGMSHLLEQTSLTLEQKNYINGIHQAGLAMAQLVDDLLDYATLQAGRFRLNSRAENLRQLLESVVEMLAPRAHEKSIEIGATVAFDVPTLMDFDPARLRQVLFNVIGNAVKFTTSGGVLARVAMDGGDVVITVADTGPGMTREEQQRIFVEFEQAGTAAERSGGTGLGLSIATRILREFGGSLSVASEKGRGTTFTIRFPASFVDAGKEGNDRMLLLRSSRVLLIAPSGPAAGATIATIETLGGRCRHVRSLNEAEFTIAQLARQGMAFTDVIVDHRVGGILPPPSTMQSMRRILLVSPEERAAQPWDSFDAWLIRPLREQSLVDVLRGRLGGVAGRLPQDMRVEMRPQAPAPQRRLSVLLAEDDPVSAMMVGAALRKAGHAVQHVGDLVALREAALAERHPDVIISDIHMPGGDLGQVLTSLGERRSNGQGRAPVLVLSGEMNEDLQQDMLRRGACCVLQKPVDPQVLLREMEAAVTRCLTA
ncbi:hybrid sensor histidine kinase/response regulator [Rhizobium sp. CSW-27]|uniref:hybrid sensor histidine kinase/response regulator n=1 Tax=Rhizobium sp. CSW-27 TaxID=2839985 RepID=UPI001C019899|nr:hybrid sensor histidine kinase/response regulator [Rhizobium sp. CSW-27]MBT9372128.1 hybrid sensor histidine kinase/response regulator [Rhizobium sp. CSW-27]